MVGDDQADYLLEMKGYAARIGVAEQVIWSGIRTEEDLLAEYFGADLFVMTSAHENFSNATAEAMALGLPVVVSGRCGIARDVRRRHAGRVVPLDGMATAQAIRSIFSEPAVYEQLSENAEEAAIELYRPEEIAGRTMDEFEEVIGYKRR